MTTKQHAQIKKDLVKGGLYNKNIPHRKANRLVIQLNNIQEKNITTFLRR